MRSFSIRDLFWLTLVAALAVGWVVDRGRIAAELRTKQAEWVEAIVGENLKRHEAEDALEGAKAQLELLKSP